MKTFVSFTRNNPHTTPKKTIGEAYDKGFRKEQHTGSYGLFDTTHVKSDGERYPSDIVYFKTAESEGEIFHPTQKPVSLGRYLIRTYTNPDDLILDNTCGSGSFLVSAVLEGRNFVGIELNKETILHHKHKVDIVQVCNQRIEQSRKEYAQKKIQKKLLEEDQQPQNGDKFTLHMPLLA